MVTAKPKEGNIAQTISIPAEIDQLIRKQKTPFKHGDYSKVVIVAVLEKYAPELLQKYAPKPEDQP